MPPNTENGSISAGIPGEAILRDTIEAAEEENNLNEPSEEAAKPTGIPEGTELRDIEAPEEDLNTEPEETEPTETGTTQQAAETLTGIPEGTKLRDIEAPEEDLNEEPQEKAAEPPSGIPEGTELRDIEAPEEDLNAEPQEEATEPTGTTTAEQEAETEETRKRIELGVIRDDDVIDKNAALQARKDFHERMSKGKLWEFWRWPEKIALRLSEGGIENIQQERLRRACITNGVSFLDMDQVRGAASDANREQTEKREKSLLERFAANRIIRREGTQNRVIEEKVLLAEDSPLRASLLADIIKPVVDGEITGTRTEQRKQIQDKLTELIKKNINDPKVREIFGAQASEYGYSAEYFATDILEKSLAVKEQMDRHKESLDEISKFIDIHIGIARDQANTDVRNKVDKAVAWARSKQNDRLATGAVREVMGNRGWILNPAVVGIAASLGTYGLLRSAGFGGRVAGIAAPVTGAMGGALVAGAQRYVEIGADQKMDTAESAMGEVLPEKKHARDFLGRAMERITGGYRREDLVQFRYDSVKTSDLINGTNGTEIANPLDNNRPPQKRTLRSVNELVTLPLDISPDMDENTRAERDENRKAVAQRMEEIRIRINRGRRERVDLLTFSDKTKVNEELNNLYSAADRLELALREKGADIADLTQKADKTWMDAFDMDKRRKDAQFFDYRARQAAGAAVFGGAVGLGSALTTGVFLQHGAAELARHVPEITKIPRVGEIFQPGQTVLEKTAHNIGTVLGHPEIGTGPASADTFKDLFAHGGKVNIGNMVAEANPDHTINFTDTAGKPIPNAPQALIESDGKIIVSGNTANLPAEMKNWVSTETLDHSLKSQIHEAVAGGETKIIKTGDAVISVNKDKIWILTADQYDAAGNIKAGQSALTGTISPDDTIHFTSGSTEAIGKVQAELAADRFETHVENAGAIAGEGAKEHFEKLGMIEKANRGEFLNNGTPGVYDRNELKLHLLSKPDGAVVVDASKMIQENTIPQSVNKDILNNADGTRTYKNFFAQFTFDNAGDNAREVVRLPMDASGQVTLPKGADLNQFFKVNPDGSVTQNLRFTEIAHLNEATGKYDILATSTGPEATAPLKPTITLDAKPPLAVEFTPPSPEAPPIIPIPFAPRNPLEPLNDESKIYYLMPITEERKKLFAQNRSQTLTENPNSILDPKTEVQQYLQKQSPEYKQKIDELVEQITAPPNPNLRAVVCIPVAGHEEGEHIYDTLLNYSYQDAPKDQYEILLFVNNPEGTNLDKTVDEIKRFQQDHPDLPVRMMYKQLPKSEAKMAVIRKYLNDAALQRNINLINGGRDLILISNDADLRGMAPEYISNFIDKFDKDSRMDALVGQLDWDPASYVEYPVIHAGTRLFQYLNLLLWNGRGGDRPSSGASTAFKSSIYAGVGGYQINEMPGAEDVILGQAIRTARGSSNSMGYAGARVSRLYTSSRRAIDAWATGFAPIEQWDRNWGAINEQVRRLKIGQHQTVNYDDPVVIEQLKADLEKVIGRTLNYFGDSDEKLDAPLLKRAVSFLGISYTLNSSGGIEITDMGNFIKGIKRFQQKGEILQQVKSGKLPKSALIQFEEESTLPTPTSQAETLTPQIGAQTIIAYNRIKELASQFKTATGERKNTIAADLAQIIGQVEASTGTKLRTDNAPLSDRDLERVERTINELVRSFQMGSAPENLQTPTPTATGGVRGAVSNIARRFRRQG